MRTNDPNLEKKDAGGVFANVYGEENQAKEQIPAPLEKSRKIALAVLAFFAILVLGSWFYQFKKSISQPYVYNGEQQNSANLQQEDFEASLKSKDTDGDGLSDWDELYFYKTSPYLEDSDSDGIIDSQEIENNQDPNCPFGRDCYSESIDQDNQENQNESINSFLEQLPAESGGDQGGAGNLSEAEIEALLTGEIDAQTLRRVLLDYGMDEKYLEQMSDEDLLRDFNEAMGGE